MHAVLRSTQFLGQHIGVNSIIAHIITQEKAVAVGKAMSYFRVHIVKIITGQITLHVLLCTLDHQNWLREQVRIGTPRRNIE